MEAGGGLGRSDSGNKPRTSGQIVAELHQLLAVAQIKSPNIFAGHSFGGLTTKISVTNSASEDHFVHFADPDLVLQTVRNLVKSL